MRTQRAAERLLSRMTRECTFRTLRVDHIGPYDPDGKLISYYVEGFTTEGEWVRVFSLEEWTGRTANK